MLTLISLSSWNVPLSVLLTADVFVYAMLRVSSLGRGSANLCVILILVYAAEVSTFSVLFVHTNLCIFFLH